MTFFFMIMATSIISGSPSKKVNTGTLYGASLTIYGHKSLPDEYNFKISSVFHRIQEENFLALNFLTTKVENSM